MRILLPIALLGLLAACSGPSVVDRSSPSITYRYDGRDTTQVEREADTYCAGFNREARLVDTARRGGENLATFECR